MTQRGRSREAGDEPTLGRTLHDAVVDERDGPLPALLLGLTVLAGVVDATSILALDHVFVAAMTGNLVILGLGLSGASGFSVVSSALALAAFVVGVLVGAVICRHAGGHRGRALRDTTIYKAVLAVSVTVTALAVGDDLPPAVRTTITVLLAFAVGVVVGGLLIRLVAIGAALAFGLLVIVVVGLSSHLVSRTPAPWSSPR